MTTGTIHTFDSNRGRGTVRCSGGALVPFSTSLPVRVGDTVTFSVIGGLTGTYAKGLRSA